MGCGALTHYRFVVSVAGGGTVYGGDATFATLGCVPPTVTTESATAIQADRGTVNGLVTANGASGTASFDFGTTTGYGTTLAGGGFSHGAAPQSFSATATGLTCGTIYHYRISATNSSGTTTGADKTFVTSACPTPTPTPVPTIAPTVAPTPDPGNGASGAVTTASPTNGGADATTVAPTPLSPPDGTTLDGTTVTFMWETPIGSGITTTSLYICDTPDFTNGQCQTPYESKIVGNLVYLEIPGGWATAGAGAAGTGLLLVGLLTPGGRRRFYQVAGAALMTATLAASCGDGGESVPTTVAESQPITLAPNTLYYWKVVNDLVDGTTIESSTSSFTTGPGA
jgi:hypothetical protein